MCLTGIVSASWNDSLVSQSSSESVRNADSLGREHETGTLSFLGGSGGHFSRAGTEIVFAVLPDEPDADRSLARQAGSRRSPEFHSLDCWQHGALQCREVGCR